MKYFVKFLGAVILLFGLLEGALILYEIRDLSAIKHMFETSGNVSDTLEHGYRYAIMLSKQVIGIGLIISGLIFGTLLLATSTIMEKQDIIINLSKRNNY